MSSPALKCFVRVSTWGLSWNKGKHIFKQSQSRCAVSALTHHCLISISLARWFDKLPELWKKSLSRRQTPLLLVPGLHFFFWPAWNSWEIFHFWGPLFQMSSCQGKSTSVSWKHSPSFQDSRSFAWNWGLCAVASHGGHQPHTKLGSVIPKHPGSSEKQFSYNYDSGSRVKIFTWLWKSRRLSSGHQDAIAIWIWSHEDSIATY